MIGIADLETEEGKTEFEEYCRSVERFIKSKVFSPTEVEELTQEMITRVLQKLSADESLKVNAGYFINTAKYVLLEHYKRVETENNRFETTNIDDENEQPLDAEPQLEKFAGERERVIFNDCLLECLDELKFNEQVLLWRYSFDEKYRLDDEEPDSNTNLFASLLDSVREIRDKFLSLQNDYSPVTEDIRVRVSRWRKKLRTCLSACVSRKKGFR